MELFWKLLIDISHFAAWKKKLFKGDFPPPTPTMLSREYQIPQKFCIYDYSKCAL